MRITGAWKLPRLKRNKHRFGFGGGSNTTTQKSDPWSGQQGYLTDVFGQAQNQYNNFTPQYYGYTDGTQTGGSTVAGFNPTETSAINAIGDTGLNGSAALNSANTATTNILNSDPSNNPYFSSMNNKIMASVLPGLESQFTQGNSVNNPAMAYAASSGLGDALGSQMYGNYNQGVANQLNAAGTAQNLYGTQISGQQAALTAGQTQQQQAQNELTNNVNAFNYYQQLPYNKLNQYSNLVQGQYGNTTSTSSPMQSMFGSLFSDRRLKKNIKRLGTSRNGLGVYSFNYIWDEKPTTGYMADEVEKLMPEAVGNIMGFKTVNYAMVEA